MELCKLVLYEKARGAKYFSQSKVDESVNEAKYFAIVLFTTSHVALVWGCAGVVVLCLTCNNWHSSLFSLFTNSLP